MAKKVLYRPAAGGTGKDGFEPVCEWQRWLWASKEELRGFLHDRGSVGGASS